MVIEERRDAGKRNGTTNGRVTPTITDADIDLSDNARVVLEKRYLRKNAKGEIIETPAGMFRRVAHAIAAPEYEDGPTEEA
ncbi:MAG: hypothetical protein OXD46_13465, partial [Chloroflexi bacterium]|nr:hypothetical protein [Chloroflexota bacterium]